MELAEILELVKAVRENGVADLSVAQGDFRMRIRMTAAEPAVAPPPPHAYPPPGAWPAPPAWPQAAPPVPPTPPAPPASAVTVEVGGEAAPASAKKTVMVTAPMVGTFYRSPSPDAAPFVELGDGIKVGQTVCIIEAMKLMNELEAEVSGKIVRFLVENGDPVEFGQPLIELDQG